MNLKQTKKIIEKINKKNWLLEKISTVEKTSSTNGKKEKKIEITNNRNKTVNTTIKPCKFFLKRYLWTAIHM